MLFLATGHGCTLRYFRKVEILMLYMEAIGSFFKTLPNLHFTLVNMVLVLHFYCKGRFLFRVLNKANRNSNCWG